MTLSIEMFFIDLRGGVGDELGVSPTDNGYSDAPLLLLVIIKSSIGLWYL
jgi:hypothetical protein